MKEGKICVWKRNLKKQSRLHAACCAESGEEDFLAGNACMRPASVESGREKERLAEIV